MYIYYWIVTRLTCTPCTWLWVEFQPLPTSWRYRYTKIRINGREKNRCIPVAVTQLDRVCDLESTGKYGGEGMWNKGFVYFRYLLELILGRWFFGGGGGFIFFYVFVCSVLYHKLTLRGHWSFSKPWFDSSVIFCITKLKHSNTCSGVRSWVGLWIVV